MSSQGTTDQTLHKFRYILGGRKVGRVLNMAIASSSGDVQKVDFVHLEGVDLWTFVVHEMQEPRRGFKRLEDTATNTWRSPIPNPPHPPAAMSSKRHFRGLLLPLSTYLEDSNLQGPYIKESRLPKFHFS